MNTQQLPKARKDRLIIKELQDETLVYDTQNDSAHCLNQTATLVWKQCDGTNNVSQIVRLMGEQTRSHVDDRLVWLALDQLKKFDLLEGEAPKPVEAAGINRRQLIKTIGVTALALPVIMSISAPAAMAQGSVICCGAPGDCAAVPGTTCKQFPPCSTMPSTKGCIP